jgi:ABC-type transport system substrate-binding protein
MRSRRALAVIVTATTLVAITSSVRAVDVSSPTMRYFGSTERIRGFDPITSGDVPTAAAIYKIYEGLLEYEYLARPYKVRPLLAESLPEVSPDGLTYTFKIKRGVRFHDNPCFPGGKGRELTAEDFVYSWKRLADVRNKSTGYWVFEGRIVGLDEFHKKSIDQRVSYDEPVEGIQALDRYTLQVKVKEPYPQLLWILTMDYTFALPREAAEYYGDELLNNPVGTGPFLVKSWRRSYRIEFVRNPNYHGDTYPSEGEPGDREAGLLDDAGKSLPILDSVVQYVISDDSTEWLMFLSGRLAASGIGRSNFDAVITGQKELTAELKARGVRLEKSPMMDTTYIGFNMEDPVVGPNKKLRQALCCAIDIGKYCKFYNDRLMPAKGPIPPKVAGHDDAGPFPYPFDLERAKRLLAEAGYPDGRDPKTGKRLVLTMDTGSAADPEVRQANELIASFFEAVGVELKVSPNNWPEYLKKLERRQVQLYQLIWRIDYPDAGNFLMLFYSKNASPGPNHTNYNNPAFDRLYDKIRTMQDSPERTAIYRQMATMVVEDAPWIFMTHPLSYGLYQPWLKNFKSHDFPYPNVKFYKVDPALMKER